MVINPIIGFYIPIIRIPIKGGMTIPNIATFDHGTYHSNRKLKYPLVNDHIAIAGISTFSIGKKSSFRVHFPASYVSLPEWYLKSSLKIMTTSEFHNFVRHENFQILYGKKTSRLEQLHRPNYFTCARKVHNIDSSQMKTLSYVILFLTCAFPHSSQLCYRENISFPSSTLQKSLVR